jgi:hypothetical protein
MEVTFNVFFLLIVAIAVAGMVLSHRIKDGVVVKFGLILISVGLMGAAGMLSDHRTDFLSALNLIACGVAVCIAGAWLRGLLTRGKCRRLSDWVDHGPVDTAR